MVGDRLNTACLTCLTVCPRSSPRNDPRAAIRVRQLRFCGAAAPLSQLGTRFAAARLTMVRRNSCIAAYLRTRKFCGVCVPWDELLRGAADGQLGLCLVFSVSNSCWLGGPLLSGIVSRFGRQIWASLLFGAPQITVLMDRWADGHARGSTARSMTAVWDLACGWAAAAQPESATNDSGSLLHFFFLLQRLSRRPTDRQPTCSARARKRQAGTDAASEASSEAHISLF